MNGRGSRNKGASFERTIVDYLRANDYPAALRTRTPGQEADRGDIAGVPLTLELKNCVKIDLPGWWRQVAKASDKTGLPPIIVHKRKGTTAPGQQWVTLSLETLLRILKEQ